MSLGQQIIDTIKNRQDRKRKEQTGAEGQFWRDGGNNLLYDLPVTTSSLVIDAGGYEGEWSAEMISRYGCSSQIFEPAPEFFKHCQTRFERNKLVRVHQAALGGSDRKTTFSLLDNGTSAYRGGKVDQSFEADVIDISRIFAEVKTRIACLKLNIEGGEYEVLDRLLETNNIARCDSLLIQFHRQPQGYASRYESIEKCLRQTHTRVWSYEMVWEKWIQKGMQP